MPIRIDRKAACLVHNGIIENYQQLKQQLEKDGYKFESETDTEVVAHLIDKYLQKGQKLADAVRLRRKMCGAVMRWPSFLSGNPGR